eukprot:TRINITY_DN25214_c0_g1_i4.p1 TRINITY_DN25214_c0_g1~~TRINITY_DN25214_c0_g1_i4.p1  ORF type:complete len:1004 (+),score=164.11 TRINITY_DN25214_c0_g1_i4:81-3014(+)
MADGPCAEAAAEAIERRVRHTQQQVIAVWNGPRAPALLESAPTSECGSSPHHHPLCSPQSAWDQQRAAADSGSPLQQALLPCPNDGEVTTSSVQPISPSLLVSMSDPLLSPRSPFSRGAAAAAASAAGAALCSPQGPRSGGPSARGAPAAAAEGGGAADSGLAARLGDGLEGGSYAVTELRIEELRRQMAENTLQRADYPRPGERLPVFEWAATLPTAFQKLFSAGERRQLGAMYNPSAVDLCLVFHDEDIIQSAAERLPCGGCKPRTLLRACGLHGDSRIELCKESMECLHAGGTRGGATCLFDNFARVGGRVASVLRGQAPPVPEAGLDAAVIAALGREDPEEIAEGVSAAFTYTYEIKVPPGTVDHVRGSRPTQIYRVLGCAMRSLGDPVSRARLTAEQRLLWQRVIELFRPFQWILDEFLLTLPHLPSIVYRGIDIRVSEHYDEASIVQWVPATSTSISREVAWSFMAEAGSGTFFVVLAVSVASIAAFSWLPGEQEFLLHSRSLHRVTGKVRPAILAMLGTNHDIVVLMQVDGRGGALSEKEVVDARVYLWRESTSLFDEFLSVYVPPEVGVGRTESGNAATGSEPLLRTVSGFLRSPDRTALLVGDGGSGKTTSALAIVRAAAGRVDPLPLAPGQTEPWAPLYIPLPVVRLLLAPGTGSGHMLQPISEYIDTITHMNASEAAELRQRPVLFVLDGLEEIPASLAGLRGRGLFEAGGLSLPDWPQARVIVCIRVEVMQKRHGYCCCRWRLRAGDVVPTAPLWHMRPFAAPQATAFRSGVVRRELQKLVKVAGAGDAGPAELDAAVAACRCALPSQTGAAGLQAEVRRLRAAGAGLDAAVAEVVSSLAGIAYRDAMFAAVGEVVARIGTTDESLTSSPFTLSMVIAVGHTLAEADVSGCTRTTLYCARPPAQLALGAPQYAPHNSVCGPRRKCDSVCRESLAASVPVRSSPLLMQRDRWSLYSGSHPPWRPRT